MIVAGVLVGGVSARFGVNKLLYPLKGKPLILHVLDRLSLCKAISKAVLVGCTQTLNLYSWIGVDAIADNLCIGPLGAVYSALKIISEVLIVGGDMPGITCGYVEDLIRLCRGYRYACIPAWSSGYMEPLAAIYNKEVLPALEYGIAVGEHSIQKLIKLVRVPVKLIDIEKHLAKHTNAFLNINTLKDIRILSEAIP